MAREDINEGERGKKKEALQSWHHLITVPVFTSLVILGTHGFSGDLILRGYPTRSLGLT